MTTVAIPYGWFEPGHAAGGIVTSLVRVLDTAGESLSISVQTRDKDLGATESYPGLRGTTVARGRHTVTYLDADSRLLPFRVIRALRRERPDILYVNGLFSVPFSIAPLVAVRLGLLRPKMLLLAPRGSLSEGAIEIRSRRKTWWLRLVRATGLLRRAVFHASTGMEATDIAREFAGSEVLICEDQVDLPGAANPPGHSEIVPRLVFISRISPKKNLLGALEALRHVDRPTVFDIYGPLEDAGYWAKCAALIEGLPAAVTVTYRGVLTTDQVVETFGNYDAFLFPTKGENFGHVIAESLAASCFVITTEHSPWAEWLGDGGHVATSEESFAEEVQRVTRLGPRERHLLRIRAGEAFRSWRSRHPGENVLDLVIAQYPDDPEIRVKVADIDGARPHHPNRKGR